MDSDRVNVIILGLGWSGSSVCVDLLREYDDVGVFHGEFEPFRHPGLIGDILSGKEDPREGFRHFHNFLRTLRTVRRKAFIRSCIPDGIFKRAFPGRGGYSRAASQRRLLPLTSELRYLDRFLRVARKATDKGLILDKARELVRSMGEIYAKGKFFKVFDGALRIDHHSMDIWSEVFHPFKVIYVVRNPPDQMANIWKHRDYLYGTIQSGKPVCEFYRRDKTSKQPLHCTALGTLTRMRIIDEIRRTLPATQFLLLRFESFVQEYEKTKKKVETFLGLEPEKHREKFSYFDPKKSEKNIGISRTYLDDSDIRKLSELSDWYAVQA